MIVPGTVVTVEPCRILVNTVGMCALYLYEVGESSIQVVTVFENAF